MLNPARWRSQKKIKAVLQLQFHASRVPQSGKTSLGIALVPEDVGKPTVRLQKAAVQNGICSWENPIYETVKFICNLKTGKIDDKIYHFIVTTGTSKSSFIGEVSLNFSDYAEAAEPCYVSLPLNNSSSGAILHLTIRRMKESFDDGMNQNGAATVNSGDTNVKQIYEADEDTDMAPMNADLNGSFRVPSSNNVALASTSDKALVQRDTESIPNPLKQSSKPPEQAANGSTTKKALADCRSSMEHSVSGGASNPRLGDFLNGFDDSKEKWVEASDGTVRNSLNDSEEKWLEASDGTGMNSLNDSKEKSLGTSDGTIRQLKNEIAMLLRQAQVTELEVQSLRKHVAKEGKRGQNLSRQISNLKQERDALKIECEQLQQLHSSQQKCTSGMEDINDLRLESKSVSTLLEEIRQELSHERDLNTSLRLQLQKTECSNTELVLAVRELDEMLEQKDKEMSRLLKRTETCKNAEEVQERVPKWKSDDRDKPAPRVEEDNNAMDVGLLKQKITDLCGEIEVYRKDGEELQIKMQQLALDNEILNQENHHLSSKVAQNELHQSETQNDLLNNVQELEIQVQMLEKDYKKKEQEGLESFCKVNELETHVKSLEKGMKRQAEVFEDDLETITRDKIKMEKMAIQAEEALRQTILDSANTTKQLQEDLRKITMEMESKIDETEKLALKATTESYELHSQIKVLEEKLQTVNEELDFTVDQHRVKMQLFSEQLSTKAAQMKQMQLELDNKARQIECAKRNHEEKNKSFLKEIEILKAKIAKMGREKHDLSEQNEKLKTDVEQMKSEMGQLERKFASARKEADNLEKELSTLKCCYSKSETGWRKGLNAFSSNAANVCRCTELSTAAAVLEERNRSMEGELKDLQERYSEVSLKFAEVEGERQKLVITVRNLKNAKN